MLHKTHVIVCTHANNHTLRTAALKKLEVRHKEEEAYGAAMKRRFR